MLTTFHTVGPRAVCVVSGKWSWFISRQISPKGVSLGFRIFWQGSHLFASTKVFVSFRFRGPEEVFVSFGPKGFRIFEVRITKKSRPKARTMNDVHDVCVVEISIGRHPYALRLILDMDGKYYHFIRSNEIHVLHCLRRRGDEFDLYLGACKQQNWNDL